MVELSLPENSKIVEGKPSEKKEKIPFASIFTDGIEKIIETQESISFM